MTLLQINASIFSGQGQSTRLADEFVAAWRESNPGAKVIVRSLAESTVPHLDAERFGAFLAKAGERSSEQQAVVDYSDALIDELKRADVLVLGLPMYNFGVPSTLKAYIDHIARAGATFKYTDKGPVGLLTGKKAYVFATRGGLYAGTTLDTQTAYVRDILRFLGIDDVEFVYAEGLAIGAERKAAALSAAQRAIERLAALEAIAA
ncbi:MAG TPA: FMN-dependent NADH-azoreductase [Casimicrobiaceae bacterium]|jgi:FMN-dependent NADH-azoreductase|nr:FMN-dependent NADH-azoreductase [Casimicrobiaceae bacterium]